MNHCVHQIGAGHVSWIGKFRDTSQLAIDCIRRFGGRHRRFGRGRTRGLRSERDKGSNSACPQNEEFGLGSRRTLAHQVVKNYGGEAFERQRFDNASRENLRQGMKMVITTSISTPLVQLLLAVAMGGVIWIALQPALMNGITAGEFVSYIVAAGMLQKPVRALTDINEKIQRGVAASADVFAMLDLPDEPDHGSLAPARLRGEIEFRHVTFAYQDGKPVLVKKSWPIIRVNIRNAHEVS